MATDALITDPNESIGNTSPDATAVGFAPSPNAYTPADAQRMWDQSTALGMSTDDIWKYMQQHSYFGPRIKASLDAGADRDDVLYHLEILKGAKEPQYGPAEEAASAVLANQGPRVGAAYSALTGGPSYSDALEQLQAAQAGYRKENPLTAAGIDIAGGIPLALAGGAGVSAAARTVPLAGRFLAGEQGGNMLMRMASQGTAGALQGGAFGALEGKPLEGALGGAALGAGGAPVLRAVTGAPLTPEVATLAQKFLDQGIPLKTANITGVGKVAPEQSAAFTRALAKTFGTDLPEGTGLTQQVMSDTEDRIGDQFNEAAKHLLIDTHLPVSQTFDGGLPSQSFTDRLAALRTVADGATDNPKRLNSVLDSIEEKAASGTISGKDYQALTTKASPLGQLLRDPNTNVRNAARYIRDTLDSGLEMYGQNAAYSGGGMTAGTSVPLESINLLSQSRREWKNMLTAESLANAAGPDKMVDPKLLKAQVLKFNPNYAFAGTPGSELGDLAEGGKAFLGGPAAKNKLLNLTLPSGWKTLVGAETAGGAGLAGMEHLLQNPSTMLTAATVAGVPLAMSAARAIARRPNALIPRSLGPAAEGTFGNARRALLPATTALLSRYLTPP